MTSKLPEHFCSVPFALFSSKPDGSIRLCNYSQTAYVLNEEGQRYNLSENTIDEVWHSKWMNRFREKMLSQNVPAECQVCHKEEACGKTSKRFIENKKYLEKSQDSISYAEKNHGKVETFPVHFDLRLGNLCNLKCRTCNPLFSSTWAKEVESYPDSVVLQAYQGSLDRARTNKSWHKDPAVWAKFHDIAGSIEEIYLTGGEPMMIKEHYSLLKFLTENDYAKNITIRYSTNLTMLPDEFLQYAPSFKKISMSCSIDAYGLRNDWLRSPSKWAKIEENFMKALMLPDSVYLDINATLSIFNVYYFDELFLYFKKLSKESGRNFHVFTDILYEPDFMQMKLLPDHLKEKTRHKLKALLKFEDLTLGERKNIFSILNSLDEVDENVDQRRVELRQHILELDKIRNEDFVSVFPELAELVAPSLFALCTPPILVHPKAV